jgi:hypothetical protein
MAASTLLNMFTVFVVKRFRPYTNPGRFKRCCCKLVWLIVAADDKLSKSKCYGLEIRGLLKRLREGRPELKALYVSAPPFERF